MDLEITIWHLYAVFAANTLSLSLSFSVSTPGETVILVRILVEKLKNHKTISLDTKFSSLVTMYVYVCTITYIFSLGPRPYSLLLFESFQGIPYEP